ncbi:hypothetical protein P154DRAFT_571847 [Amniculicola lignicola CBS 123094]|uniref:Uncharacterized protein n=1 Tax=Amniculicola lignicola CBS 123094 TaxID=1392246 RepID=A0A6A5WRZ3_9PLEO|nr:hypothetical protein P154DRAFT_571847 [Amniculicola lignicola CBS 123094]
MIQPVSTTPLRTRPAKPGGGGVAKPTYGRSHTRYPISESVNSFRPSPKRCIEISPYGYIIAHHCHHNVNRLRQFKVAGDSKLIPGNLVRVYQDLEYLTLHIFSKNPDSTTLHFHLSDEECEDEVDPYIWKLGSYFEPEFLSDGRLVIFVHFVDESLGSDTKMLKPGVLEGNQEAHASPLFKKAHPFL